MKVHNRSFRSTAAAIGQAVLALTIALVLSLSTFVPTASAITREKVIDRAQVWVKKRIPYSQRSTYRGYRKDCSGFVSMAWGLKRSYSTRTIHQRGKRVAIRNLKPGDAVLVRGRHVSLFVRWKNKRARTFVAAEQTTWGSHAKQRVRTVPSRAIGLRRDGITG